MPTTIEDLVRLDPSHGPLWNGEKWTQVLGWNESDRGDPLEIELRSGERIGCRRATYGRRSAGTSAPTSSRWAT